MTEYKLAKDVCMKCKQNIDGSNVGHKLIRWCKGYKWNLTKLFAIDARVPCKEPER